MANRGLPICEPAPYIGLVCQPEYAPVESQDTETQVDECIVRFYRYLVLETIRDALKCAKGDARSFKKCGGGRVWKPEKELAEMRQVLYRWIQTRNFRRACQGLGYDFAAVEKIVRETIQGKHTDRIELLFEEFDQEAVHYARRSSGRPRKGQAGAETEGQARGS